eukprot:588034-Pyramimonas_sp.AAC.1
MRRHKRAPSKAHEGSLQDGPQSTQTSAKKCWCLVPTGGRCSRLSAAWIGALHEGPQGGPRRPQQGPKDSLKMKASNHCPTTPC